MGVLAKPFTREANVLGTRVGLRDARVFSLVTQAGAHDIEGSTIAAERTSSVDSVDTKANCRASKRTGRATRIS
jgi:hypothetical protein